MKVKAAFSIFCLLWCATPVVHSQNTQQPETITTASALPNVATSLHGSVKTVTETNLWNGNTTVNTFHFNESKQLTGAHLTTYSGNLTLDATYEYTPSGQVAKKIITQTKKYGDLGVAYKYQGNTIFETPFDKDAPSLYADKGTTTIEYTYYEDGTRATERTTDEKSVSNRYYNKNGNIAREESQHGDFSTEITYDEEGNVIKYLQDGEEMHMGFISMEVGDGPAMEYDAQGRIVSLISEEYNDYIRWAYTLEGYLSSIHTLDPWWGTSSVLYHDYKFDEQGNWTERSVDMTGEYYGEEGFSYVATREYTYY